MSRDPGLLEQMLPFLTSTAGAIGTGGRNPLGKIYWSLDSDASFGSHCGNRPVTNKHGPHFGFRHSGTKLYYRKQYEKRYILFYGKNFPQ